MNEEKNKQLFFSLVYTFQMQAMIQLGKLANPVTGKVERELEAAQLSIDMLDMLKEKTGENLSEDEKRFINQVNADLKLNYVEEKAKQEEEKRNKPEEKNETVPENIGKEGSEQSAGESKN